MERAAPLLDSKDPVSNILEPAKEDHVNPIDGMHQV
jgi:hypothetical protein